MERDGEYTEITAEEAFAILGNETRIAILRRLWEAGEPCSYTEIRQAVAPGDEGNFNYHLRKLTDHFVRKIEDGYVLRFAGEQVVRAVMSGQITSDPSIPPAETGDCCPYCGAPVEMAYREEIISVRCTDCGGVTRSDLPEGTVMYFEFPPAGLDGREREEAIDAAHVLYDAKIAPMIKGVCPECGGQIDISNEVCTDHDSGAGEVCTQCDTRYAVWSQFTCENCLYSRRAPPWFATLNHPAVVAFYHEHGLDEKLPFRKLTSENARFVREITTTVTATDPYRFRVSIRVDGDTLVVSMDQQLAVRSVDRSTQSDCDG